MTQLDLFYPEKLDLDGRLDLDGAVTYIGKATYLGKRDGRAIYRVLARVENALCVVEVVTRPA